MAVAWRWHLGDVADVGRIEPVADRGTESSVGWGNWSTPRTHSTPPPIYLWAAWRLLSTRSIDRDVPATAALERRLRRHIWMISPYTPPHTRTRWRQATTHRRIMCNTYANINPVKAPSKFLLPALFGYRSRYWKDSWHSFESLCCFQRLSHLSCQDDQLQPWKILNARASRRAAGFADGSGIHPMTRWHFGFVSRCRGFETQLKRFCDGQRFSRCSTGCLRDWWSLL